MLRVFFHFFFFETVENRGKEAAVLFLMIYIGGICLRAVVYMLFSTFLFSPLSQWENIALGTLKKDA